ncbi:hypothetical protein Tco_0629321 [Tanacetum coccineum]|uniref:Uncharacterized protein n=1 Tax=Tanacetum coccineum TaxID=301880 RepID=A0ABQ4WSS7_9ASTR
MNNRVLRNNNQVQNKKMEVEEHRRIFKFLNNTKYVTVRNDNLNVSTLNVKFVCVTCGKCVFNANHDICVPKFIDDVNARTKKPQAVPIITMEPTRKVNQSVATSHKKTVASESNIHKSRSYFRMLFENASKT